MHMLAEILEMGMILCFGISWPLSVYRSYKSRSTKGKSLLFMCFIAMGYVSGIASKIIYQNFNLAFYFYFPNLIMVALDIVLYYRNTKLDAARLNGVEK